MSFSPFIRHLFVLPSLLIISSDFAAMGGHDAYKLNLPGSSIAQFTPILVLITYLLAVILWKSNKWFRLIWVLVGLFVVYPVMLLSLFSHSIKTNDRLSYDDLKRFKAEFGVPAVRQRPRIIVAKRDFRPEMETWLREMAEAAKTKAEANAPANLLTNPIK